ncbi:aminotransferase class I/II-fold pyridoxal phosphate-dependent enzyme [Marinomonas fungiae]|uniref:Aminotransferase n=1 Tax=Marinomonas fungiae TaxID=1137284 RepID=A0A0K6IT99_9GAMM|nr:aminotransferase class I/II-fold pyridoxal phosphate-dependent enzyme [Marinomonas fungiae]CUB06289.1 Aspartate/methionine/tyrosine aminotransferase [Marinomonas fungiae]
MQTLAKRVEQIAPFQVMAVMERAKQLQAVGKDVIHLEVGEPDFSAPAAVNEAGMAAIRDGKTGYTAATGLPELRQAISDFYQQRYDVNVAPERIVVTPGASGALLLLSSLMAEVGSEVLMPDPCYPCNRHFLLQVGAKARMLECLSENNFEIDLSALEGHWQEQTTGLWLASPANPTGSVLSADYIAKAWEIVKQQGGHMLVDEIYQGLVFDGEDFTALSVSDDIFVVNSFSKYFAMTGWRLGWIVVPQWAIEGATKLAQNLFISAPSIAQHAALRAFQPDVLAECEQRRQTLAERRMTLVQGLERLGLPIASAPQGAFYVYVDVSSITSDAMQWCLALLQTEFVALTPGADFGMKDAHKYVRFAYTCDCARIEQALQRIERFIQS